MKRRGIIVAGIVILGVAAAVMTFRKGGPSAGATPAPVVTPTTPTAVAIVAARRADLVTRITATGTVTALREARIAPKLPGLVAAVLVEEGDRVAEGTPLLRLDGSSMIAAQAQARAGVMAARARLAQLVAGARPEERRQAADAVAQAEAAVQAARIRLWSLQRGARPQEREQAANAVAQAKAALDMAQADVDRMRILFAQGAVAKQQLDAAETQLRVARAAYDSARQQQSLVNEGPRREEIQAAQAQLAQAQAAYDSTRQSLRLVEMGPRAEEIDGARAQLASAEALLAAATISVRDVTVTAPFAGTIVQRLVEPGESASPGVPAFLLAQLDGVNVELAVPERHRSALRQDQSVVIQVDSLPGRTFRGQITEISPGAAVQSRSFTVKVRVANSDQTLRPGMFARGTIVTSTRPGVLQIPERALLTTGGGTIVFVVQNGRAVRRAVVTGARQGGVVEIRSGIREGEQVVVEGEEGLTDNQAVFPRTPQR